MSWRVNNPEFLVNYWPMVGGKIQPVVRTDVMAYKGSQKAWEENPYGNSVPYFDASVNAGIQGTEISIYQHVNFSFGGWFINPPAGAGTATPFNFGNGNTFNPPEVQFGFIQNSSEQIDLRCCDGVTSNSVNGVWGAVNDDVPHHVMGVFDDNHIILYFDGEYSNSISRTMTGSPVGDVPVGFGGYGGGSTAHTWLGNAWAGRFYNVPLSGEEVKFIYDRKI